VETLRRCCHPAGLQASGRREGHHQVWARDSMISLLGARFIPEPSIRSSLLESIATLRRGQSPAGAIPNNVDSQTLRPNFRAYADGGLWWIVGSSLLAPAPPVTRSILRWYECQDVDRSGLLSMQESTDWQDLFCTRGKGLYLNCLYVLALRAAARVLNDAELNQRAEAVSHRINEWMWYNGDGQMLRHISHSFSTESPKDQDSLGRKRYIPPKLRLRDEPHYLPWLGFRAVGEWFDTLGNLLAILAGVADESRTTTILDFITRHRLHRWPCISLVPPVRPGDPDWRDYYGLLNLPDHYHNGGVWPFIGGFYVAALVRAGRPNEATEALSELAELNLRGEFNEWHHGETGEPMGVRDQAWSAGIFLFAAECVRRGTGDLILAD
jgi:hypothetical protein